MDYCLLHVSNCELCGFLQKRMQQIIMHCFQAVKGKLDCRLGYFDLIGCDFLIDENFKVRHKQGYTV